MSLARLVPTLVAAATGLVMIWLADEPFAVIARAVPAEQGGLASLVEPGPGPWPRFPDRFSWEAVRGADEYEITVIPAGRPPLFRQRGRTTVLELALDPAAAPPAGDYVWTVEAWREGRSLGLAYGTFRVTGR